MRFFNQKGFTLIEVVIAMTIMAFLTVMVSQSMRRSAEFKTKIQKNIDQRSAINSAMRIIERDINLAFHYQDVATEVLKEIEKKKKSGAGGNTSAGTATGAGAGTTTKGAAGNPANQMYANFKIRDIPNFTAFKGEKNAISFSNLNNISIQPGEKASDQQEVSYFVKSCKSLADPNVSTKCLWRRTSPFIDDKIDEGGTESVLIEGVTKFELRYFGKEKEDWVSSWDSTSDDDTIKNKFPSAVEVTLTVEQNKKEISAIRVVALRFPNNMDTNNSNSPTQPMGEAPPPPSLPGSGN